MLALEISQGETAGSSRNVTWLKTSTFLPRLRQGRYLTKTPCRLAPGGNPAPIWLVFSWRGFMEKRYRLTFTESERVDLRKLASVGKEAALKLFERES